MKRLFRYLPCFIGLVFVMAMGSGCSKAAKAKRLLASAEHDYAAQEYDAAELKYRGVMRLSFMDPVAIQRLGLLYCAEGRPTQAAPYLKKALEQNPNDMEVQLKMAQTLGALGNPRGAFILAARILEKEPANEDALLLCVDLARTVTNLTVVRKRIEKLQATGPDSPSYNVGLGWIDLRLRQTNAASSELEKALKLDPKHSATYVAMAALALERQDLQSASNYYSTAADLSPIRSSARLKFADFQVRSGNPQGAEQVLTDVTRQAPDYIPAWVGLMQAYYSEQKYDQCSEVIAKILARDSANLEALMQSGNIYMVKHDATNAVATYKRVATIPQFEKLPEVKYRLALAYLLEGDRADAVASLTDALALNHDYSDATLLLAELDVRGGNSGAAINLLLPLVKRATNDFKVHLLLATAYMAEQQPNDALAVYQQMETVFPKSPEVPRLMGIVYEQEGKAAEARTAFERSLAAEPDFLPTLEKITDLDVQSKNFDAAESRLSAAIARNPKLAQPVLLQGQVYWAAGKTNDAESFLSKAIELNPDLPGAYLTLARIYLSSHQEDQALARLNSLVSKTNDVTALLEIGQIHQEANQMDAARDAYEKLISVQPNFSPALNNLAYIYSEHYTNIEKAAEMAERARKASPGNPYVADTLAWILYKQGQYPRALSLMQESIEKEPNDPEVRMHLGMIYYMLEEEDLARVNLKLALSTDTDYAGKAEARQCLDLLAIDPTTATPEIIDRLEKRLHDNPRDPVPLNLLGTIHEMHGEIDKAADAYQKLIAQNPQNSKAMIKLARLYAGPLHESRKALELAKSAHEVAPGDPRATAMLGELVYASGDYSWALSLLEDSVPKLTNQTSAQIDLALAYFAVGRIADADTAMDTVVQSGASSTNLDQAKQFQAFRAAAKDPTGSAIPAAQIQAVLGKDPHYLPALALSAILSERQGDSANAAKTYEQILADYPKFTPAIRQLTMIYANQSGSEAKAYTLGEKARAAYPDDFELARTVGILAYKKGDFQRSIQLLKQSSQKFDNDGELSYYLGMDYYQTKQPKESKKSLQQAVSNNVPPQLATEAKRVLAELK